MRVENYFKWLIFAFLSLFLVACNPTANFTYSPTTPSTGEVVKFDASKSSVYKSDEGNAIAVYAWNFGDGNKGTGKTVEHTYQEAGKYTVELSVTDLAGQTSTTTQKITIKKGTSVEKSVAISIQTATGTSIPEATVTIQGQKAITDVNGNASLNVTIPQGQLKVVALFEKAGFISQAIEYDVASLKIVSAKLLDIKQVIPVENIENAQKVESKYLGASITFSENSFAYSDGRVATGLVNVEFTPWDIQGDDLQAMPANGMAIDAQGNRAQLISAGMISATFKDANGEKLQLVSGKTADIQMDLPLNSINNQKMSIGTEIPMWHFDEVKGLWVEEGVGEVIASSASSTGLAVHAKVSHFSTWNWDFKFENPGSVFVQCQSNGIGIPCTVSALVTLIDGSKLHYSASLPEDGTTVVAMPSSGTIQWTAKNSDSDGDLFAEKTSGTSGQVIIDLGQAKTNNFVKCLLPDGTSVTCSGTLNNQKVISVSASGGRVISTIEDTDGVLEWNVKSSLIFEGNAWVRYQGKQTSSVTGNVNIKLNERIVVAEGGELLKLQVRCIPATSEYDSILAGQSCGITLNIHTDETHETLQYEARVGETLIITLPEKYKGFIHDNTGIMTELRILGQVRVPVDSFHKLYADELSLSFRPTNDSIQMLNLSHWIES